MFARSFDTMNRFQVDFDLDDEEENALLANHLEEAERGFEFLLTPHLDRRIPRLGVHHRNYVGRLMQRGGGAPLPPEGRQILPRQMEQALQRAIREQVLQDPEVQPNNHFLININSNPLRHSYHSARMRVGEWMNNDLRVQEVMQQISRMLNSNERFQLDDSFSLHISLIRDPGRGSGNRRIKKATMVLEKLLDEKKSVVKIKNDDELCCARAIVTMKAYCDFGSRDSRYRNLQRGKPAQGREGKTLHRVSGVPEGPCGLPEIDPFQKHLPEYQIVVLSLDHNYQIIFKGPPRDKHIILIKVGNHYHKCNSLSGFLGSVYFCIDCETRYEMTITRITRVKARNVTRVIKRDAWTLLQGKSLVTNALDVTGPSLDNNVWAIITFTPPPMEREPTWLKASKAFALPYANATSVTDSSDLTRSKRVTCAVLPNVLCANNTTISVNINVSFRIQRNWKKRGNYSNPENAKLTVPTPEKRKTISSFIGTVRRCKTRVSTHPT